MTMASTSRPPFAYSSDTCMFCRQFLRIATDTTESDAELEEGEAATVIDDVELYCGPPGSGPGGHHAHWTCLIDYAKQETLARSDVTPASGPPPVSGGTAALSGWTTFATCIVCGQNVLDASGRFVVDVQNEGGETKGFDFGEILEEELFLDSHPDQVHVRAFHDLVVGGDYAGAIELVAEHDVDVNATYGCEGLTALQKAAFAGDMGGVEFLKSLGATA